MSASGQQQSRDSNQQFWTVYDHHGPLQFHCSSYPPLLCKVYYIAEDSNECWTSPCLTVSQFSTNSSQYLRSNTTLVFLHGRHHLTNTLVVSNVYCLSLVSENSIAPIECTGSAHILFDFFHCIHITNLQFIGCESIHVKNVKQLVVQDSTFQRQMKSGSALKLSETMAEIAKYHLFVQCKNIHL